MANGLGVAVVTGASSGIGAIYADRLAKRGFALILVARGGAALAERAAQLRDRYHTTVETLVADLTQKEDLHRVETRLRQDPAITMLVNNAGSGVSGAFAEADPDWLEAMIRLNIVALTRLAAAAAAAFAVRGSGTIVNIGSVVALLPERFGGVYSGSKAYVLNLTQSMEVELAPRGVRVQAVLPGATRTPFWDRAGLDLDAYPASMVMEAEEMVDAALAGLDLGETVTIPALPNTASWEAFTALRQGLLPDLSRDHAAERYRGAGHVAA